MEDKRSARKKRSPFYLISLFLILILVVLILSNFSAITKPFQKLNSVLAPITIGLMIAYLANPMLRFFEFRVFRCIKRRRLNRTFSLLMTYIAIFAMIAGVVRLIIPQIIVSIEDLRNNGTLYINNILSSVNRLINAIPFIDSSSDNLLTLEKVLNVVYDWLGRSGEEVLNRFGSFAGGFLTVLKNIIVGFFVSLYVLLSKDRLNASCRRVIHALLPEKKEELFLYYSKKAHSKFGGFFIGKIVDSILIGLLSGLVFTLFHIPYATLIAVIIGVTNIIPFFGPFIGALPSAMIIFIKDPMMALLFCILILAIQQFDGNILGPLILGGSTGLSSLGILVAITVTSGLFGFGGMLIGVPLFALLLAMAEDYLISRLYNKGESVRLCDYYPADAFIKPENPDAKVKNAEQRFSAWILAVESERPNVDYTPSLWHSIGRVFRKAVLRIGRFFKHFPLAIVPKKQTSANTATAEAAIPEQEITTILPQEPEPLISPELLEEAQQTLYAAMADEAQPPDGDAATADRDEKTDAPVPQEMPAAPTAKETDTTEQK